MTKDMKGVRMFATGYGVKSKIKWKNCIYTRIYNLILNDPKIGESATDFLEINKRKYESYEECLMEFVHFYYKSGWCEIEDLLTDFINDKYFDGKKVFKCENRRIFVETDVPINKNSKIPSRSEIKEILSECLKPLIRKPVSIGWYKYLSFA